MSREGTKVAQTE